jgi:DNA-binding GntR family transcriptional regulator
MPPLRHRVYEQLEDLIVTGAFPPGSRLVEGDLAQTLGVSRGPIREALQLLWRDGFVDLRPRQGAFVHVPTEKEVEDFFDIRRALESESARLAAQRIDDESAERLRSAVARAQDLLDRGEDPSVVRREVRLHEEVTRAARNPLLAQMLASLGRRSRWYMSPFEPSLRRRAWGEHESILEAILAGDPAAAETAMEAHIERAGEESKRMIAQAGVEPQANATV